MSNYSEIDVKDITEFSKTKFKGGCNMCGHNDFEIITANGESVVLNIAKDQEILNNSVLNFGKLSLTIPIICKNCGNTIFIARHRVEAWKKEKQNGQ